jgi:hypothetical protein
VLVSTGSNASGTSPYTVRRILDKQEAQARIRRISALFAQVNPKTGKRRNLGTFRSRAAAEKHEREVQYFKRH